MIHDLKILPEYFEAILSGEKTFEVRSIADRDFNKGDELRLREFESDGAPDLIPKGYSGREVTVGVTYVLNGIVFRGQPAVVMSISLTSDKDRAIKKMLGDGLVGGDFRDDIIKRG
jgi:hypothetical protein